MPVVHVESEKTGKSKSTSKKFYYLYSVADAKIIQHHVHLGTGGGQTICGQNTQSTNFYKELLKHLGESVVTNEESIKTSSGITKTHGLEFGLTELAVFDKFIAIGKYDGSIEVNFS